MFTYSTYHVTGPDAHESTRAASLTVPGGTSRSMSRRPTFQRQFRRLAALYNDMAGLHREIADIFAELGSADEDEVGEREEHIKEIATKEWLRTSLKGKRGF